MCSKQDILCVLNKTFLVLQARHSLCSKLGILCVPGRTFPVFQARHFLCSKQAIPFGPRMTFSTKNGRKVMRIALILMIFRQNPSQRPDLFFSKHPRRWKIYRTNGKKLSCRRRRRESFPPSHLISIHKFLTAMRLRPRSMVGYLWSA